MVRHVGFRGAVALASILLVLLALPFATAVTGPIAPSLNVAPHQLTQQTLKHQLLLAPMPGGGIGFSSKIVIEEPSPLPTSGMVKVGQGLHAEWWADDACKTNSKNGGQDDFPNPDNVSRLVAAFDNLTYTSYDQVFNQQPNMRINMVSIDGPQNVGGNCCSGNSMNVDCADVYDRQYNYRAGPMIVAHEAYHYIHSGSAGQWVEEGQANMGAAMTVGPNDQGLLSGILGFFRQKHNEPIETCCSDGIQYGRAYSFWEYLAEAYCGNATRKHVFDSPSSNGAATAAQQCNRPGVTFDDLIVDWTVANYVDDPRLNNGRYGYNETVFMEPMSESADDKVTTYPHNGSGTVQSHAAWYARFTVAPPVKGDVALNFSASSGSMRVFLAGTPTQKGALAEVKEIVLSGGKGAGTMSGLGLGYKDIGLIVSGIAQGSFAFDVSLLTPVNGSLGGRTIDQNSVPVANAKVFAYQNGTTTLVAQTTSDGSGNYAFPNIKGGTYDLVGNRSGYIDGRTNGVVLVGGTSATANIQLRKLGPQDQPGTIKGMTKDTSSKVVAGVSVKAYKPGDRVTPLAQAVSVAGGDYTLAIAAGSYDLVGVLAGFKDSEALNVAVTASGTTIQDIIMKPDVPDGTVTGSVKEKVGGAPLAGAEVAGYVGATKVGSATTDSTGAYSLALPPGTYEVKASKAGYLTAIAAAVLVESSKSVTRDFEMEKSGSQPGKGTMKVTVKDAAGAPVEGASLQVKGPSSRTGTTAADGTAEFVDLTPGPYDVTASATGFKPASLKVTVVRDQLAPAELILAKDEAPPAASGSILDLQVGGVPVVALVAVLLVVAILMVVLLPKLLRRGIACPNCGNSNPRNAEMCVRCAAALPRGPPPGPMPPSGRY